MTDNKEAKEELADLIIKRMNEFCKCDRDAINMLMNTRVHCNDDLADHPTVQVRDYDGPTSVGLLGILNGIVGTIDEGPKKGFGLISAAMTPGGVELLHFKRTDNDNKS